MREIEPTTNSAIGTVATQEAPEDLSQRVSVTIDDLHYLPTPESSLVSNPRTDLEPFRDFLSYLAFKAHSLRFALELVVCIALFTVFRLALAFSPIESGWQPLSAWILACLTVSVMDHVLLIPPYFLLRRAHALDAAAKHEDALSLLEKIGPRSQRFIRYPQTAYHLTRARFLLHAESFSDARGELEFARANGLLLQPYLLTRIEIARAQGDLDQSESEIKSARELLGDHASLAFEEAFQILESRQDWRAAEKLFRRVGELPDVEHSSGMSTKSLARAFVEVCRLWTGRAEEAILSLSKEIEFLVAAYSATDNAHPYLSRLYLERSLYLATHQEPEAARSDLRLSQLLCLHPWAKRFAEKVQEEIQWRRR